MKGLRASAAVPAVVIAAAIAIGGLYLRAEHLGRDSVWHDEAFSARAARPSPAAIVSMTAAQDNNPPLYYLLLHYWTTLEGRDSEDALRGLSVLFGVLGLGGIFLAALPLAGPRVAILGSALLAASLFHVEYSREARMYTLLFLTSTLSMYTFLRLGSARRAGAWAAGWIVCTLALLMSHTGAVFMWAAEHLCWLFLASRPADPGARLAPAPWRRWLAVNAIVAAAALPWAIVVFHQHRRLGGTFWVQPPYLSEPLDVIMEIAGVPRALQLPMLAAVAGALMFAVLFRRTALAHVPVRGVTLGILLIWGAVPVLAPWIWSYIDVPILIPRVAIASLAPLLIALACAIDAVRPRWFSTAAGIALVLACAVQSWSYTHRLTKEDWRGVAALIEADARPGDLLLLHEASRRVGLEYYLRCPIADIAGFPDHRFRAGETVVPSELGELRERVAGALRVWLITAHGHDPHRLIAGTLAERFTLQRHYAYRQIGVTLFARSREIASTELTRPAPGRHDPFARPGPAVSSPPRVFFAHVPPRNNTASSRAGRD